MKFFIIAILISFSLQSFAYRFNGGDMPFPIGKIIDFPKDDGKGVWKDNLKKKIFRLRPLKGVLPDGTILVQMLGLQKKVIAEGLGEVGGDKILRASLRYMNNHGKVVHVNIANLCVDASFDNNSDLSKSCKTRQMWASMEIRQNNQMLKEAEQFLIRKVPTEN